MQIKIKQRQSKFDIKIAKVSVMIKRQNPKHKHITSFQIIILDFLSVIILGSILLMLPVATRVDFQSSLETTSLLKELDAKKIVSRAAREVHVKFLLRNGADEIVYPERQLADWTPIRYTADHILDYIELDSDHAIFEIAVPEKWIGKTVIEADVRKKHGINIMAGEIWGSSPLPEQVTRSTGIAVSSMSGLASRSFSARYFTKASYSSLAGERLDGVSAIRHLL